MVIQHLYTAEIHYDLGIIENNNMGQVGMNSLSMFRKVVKFVSSVCRLSEAFTKTLLLAPTEHDQVVASNCKHTSPVYGSETHSVLSIALTNV